MTCTWQRVSDVPDPGRRDVGRSRRFIPTSSIGIRSWALMLDAYRNTIDDEGESLDDAPAPSTTNLASIVVRTRTSCSTDLISWRLHSWSL